MLPRYSFFSTKQMSTQEMTISGGPAQIAGVQTSLIKNNEDGTFSLDELRDRIRKNPDFHEPYTSLVIIENTHNMCGGKVNRNRISLSQFPESLVFRYCPWTGSRK